MEFWRCIFTSEPNLYVSIISIPYGSASTKTKTGRDSFIDNSLMKACVFRSPKPFPWQKQNKYRRVLFKRILIYCYHNERLLQSVWNVFVEQFLKNWIFFYDQHERGIRLDLFDFAHILRYYSAWKRRIIFFFCFNITRLTNLFKRSAGLQGRNTKLLVFSLDVSVHWGTNYWKSLNMYVNETH